MIINMINITDCMTLNDIRITPKYAVFNRMDYIPNQIAFDIEIEEGVFKNTIISFRYNIMSLDLYKYSYNKIFYKGIVLKDSTLYEYDLSSICSNILLQTLV